MVVTCLYLKIKKRNGKVQYIINLQKLKYNHFIISNLKSKIKLEVELATLEVLDIYVTSLSNISAINFNRNILPLNTNKHVNLFSSHIPIFQI